MNLGVKCWAGKFLVAPVGYMIIVRGEHYFTLNRGERSMKKYRIMWDAGYGKNEEIIDAESQTKAEEEAYKRWREEAENEADYSAKLIE